MQYIYSFVAWLVPSIINWLLIFVTRKIAVVTATLASFVLLTAAFVVCIKTMITYVMTLAVIPPVFASAIGMFIPFNFSIVLSQILASQSCRWAYDKAIEKIALINNAQ